MKISCRFRISSPISYGSSGQCKSLFFSNRHFLSSLYFRCFGTKPVANCNPREQIQSIQGLGDALNVFDNISRMRPLPGVMQFNQLLSRVVNLKEYSTAIHLFKNICDLGISVNEYTMTIAINCYCRSDRVDFGLSILGWFLKLGCVPNEITFGTLLKGLFRENKINEAQELFRKMVKEDLCTLDVVIYGTVINGLCKAGNTPMAIEVLREMEKGGSCKPNTHIYNMVIDGLCKDKMIDSALKLFDEMSEKEGMAPDIVTYGTVIDGLCKAGNTPMAIEMLRVMEKGRSSCKPNTHIYNMVIDGLCKDKMIDSALKLFDEMSEKEGITPNIVTYGTVINGLCKAGNTPMAIEVLREMEKGRSCKPDTHIYNMVIDGLCKDKMIDSALKLFDEMSEKEGMKPDVVTYTIVLQGLFRCGRDSCALKLFEEMQAVGLKPNFYTYCNVLDGLCRNGRVKRALLLLDALEHKKGEIHNLHITYYNIVMEGLCKAKKLDAARAIFRDLAAKGLEPDAVTYTILIKGCCGSGLLEEAKDLLLEMEHDAGLLPNEVTYNSIIQGNLKWGKYEDASKFLEEMDAKGFSLSASTYELLLSLLETTEQNPTICKMIQKLALKQKS